MLHSGLDCVHTENTSAYALRMLRVCSKRPSFMSGTEAGASCTSECARSMLRERFMSTRCQLFMRNICSAGAWRKSKFCIYSRACSELACSVYHAFGAPIPSFPRILFQAWMRHAHCPSMIKAKIKSNKPVDVTERGLYRVMWALNWSLLLVTAIWWGVLLYGVGPIRGNKVPVPVVLSSRLLSTFFVKWVGCKWAVGKY